MGYVTGPSQPLQSVAFLHENRTFAGMGVNREKCRGCAEDEGEQSRCYVCGEWL